MSQFWTPAEDFILKTAITLTTKQLAELLPDRTPEAIQFRRRRLLGARERPTPDWTPAEDETLAEMRDDGATVTEMSKALGRTYHAVKGRLRYLARDEVRVDGTPVKRDPWPDLGPNAFQDIRVKADPAIQLSKPQDRTLAGVGTQMLVA